MRKKRGRGDDCEFLFHKIGCRRLTLVVYLFSLEDAQGRLQLLFAKQGRSRQFPSQAERDAYLNKEIKVLKTAQTAQNQRAQEIIAQIQTAREDVEDVSTRRQNNEEELTKLREGMSSTAQKQEELKRSMETKIEARKWVTALESCP